MLILSCRPNILICRPNVCRPCATRRVTHRQNIFHDHYSILCGLLEYNHIGVKIAGYNFKSKIKVELEPELYF